jgi:hypothetical protein
MRSSAAASSLRKAVWARLPTEAASEDWAPAGVAHTSAAATAATAAAARELRRGL